MDDPDVYLPVGIMVILLFILSEAYGIGPSGVFHSIGAIGQSVFSLALPAQTGILVPGLILLGILGALYLSTDFDFPELGAVAIVFVFILLVS